MKNWDSILVMNFVNVVELFVFVGRDFNILKLCLLVQ